MSDESTMRAREHIRELGISDQQKMRSVLAIDLFD
jgi:hypothetical protein